MSRARRPLLVAVLAALTAPGTAAAHLRTGTTAVDFTAAVTSPAVGSTTAFAAGVYSSDLALHLTTHGAHRVVVIGYLGEPFLRVGPHGVIVDTSSPTAASAGLLKRLPRATAGEAGRRWRLLSPARSVVWHDARVAALAPGSREATWQVPILLDGTRTEIAGRVHRYPPPKLWLWLVLLAPVPLLVLLLRTRARARVDRLCILFGAAAAAAALVLSAGFVFDPYASAGTWIAAVDEAAFVAASAAAAAWAPHRFRALGGAGLGLVGLAVALSKGAIFLHAVVLSPLPGTLCRALAYVAVAAGASAAALGPFRLLGDLVADADDLGGMPAEAPQLGH